MNRAAKKIVPRKRGQEEQEEQEQLPESVKIDRDASKTEGDQDFHQSLQRDSVTNLMRRVKIKRLDISISFLILYAYTFLPCSCMLIY